MIKNFKVQNLRLILTDPFTPGKLKNTSGPDLFGICFRTFINFLEWLGWNVKIEAFLWYIT